MGNSTAFMLIIAVAAVCLFGGCGGKYAEAGSEGAAQGIVSGRLVDASDNQVIIGATVSLVGTDLEGYTNLDGIYTIRKVPIGTYDIVFEHLDYYGDIIRGVNVSPGWNLVDIRMNRDSSKYNGIIRGAAKMTP